MCKVLIFLFVFICNLQLSFADTSKIKVGAILPLSGTAIEFGQGIKNGILLGIKDRGLDDKVQVIFEDDVLQASKSVNAASKLIDIDKVHALITFGGSTSKAVTEIAEKRNMPTIAITGLASIGRKKKFIHNIFLSSNGQAQAFSKWVVDNNFNKVSVYTTITDSMLFVRNEFLKLQSDKVISSEEVLPDETNFRSLITKNRSKKSDSVLLLLVPPQNTLLSRQIRDQGFKGSFAGGTPMHNPGEINASKGALVGAKVVCPEDKYLDGFRESYKNNFKIDPIPDSIYGYDAINIIANSESAESVNTSISNMRSYNGLAGTYPKNADNSFEVPVVLKTIQADGSVR
jgi:branched-chain amino acid transport system substrate-binding protein